VSWYATSRCLKLTLPRSGAAAAITTVSATALMLCYLRFPGRALRAGERLPAPLLAFIAGQIEVLPDCINEYLATERNRQRHAIECQEQLRLRPLDVLLPS
jgi:hypothetical protein